MAIDWSQCPAVESNPDRHGGDWVFRGTRTPISVVFENIENGAGAVMEWFDGVTREQIKAVLDFASKSTKARGSR